MLMFYAVKVLCTLVGCTPALTLGECSEVAPIVPGIPVSSEESKEDGFPGPMSSSWGHGPVEQEIHPTVWIKDGGLKGFQMETLSGRKFAAFQNVPFAQAPVGPLRFQAPVQNAGWVGIREAISPAPTCLQTDYFKLYNVSGTEDCLYLNVYTSKIPQDSEKLALPVMVFIHGGGFYFGSSNLYGPTYMMEESIVFVSINYRLGPFGFLSTGDEASPGNNGLKDQVMALKWVRENIEAFGGDPQRVTIFGESAGAGSVQLHMVSPLSRGLFHGGISESGCTFCFWSISERNTEMSRDFAKIYNCNHPNSEELVECLRKIDGTTLVQGQLSFIEWNAYPFIMFGPVIEPRHPGAFLADLPANIYARGEAAQVPWISGFNAEEGALSVASFFLNPQTLVELNAEWDRVGPIFLGLKDATPDPIRVAKNIRNYYLGERNVSYDMRHETIKMFSDRYIIMCTLKSIQYHARLNSQPVYAYQLNYRGAYGMVNLIGESTNDWGIAHLDDLIYLMNNTVYYPPLLKSSQEEYKFSRLLVNIWVNFAKTGVPFLTRSDGTEYNFWEAVSPRSVTTGDIAYAELNLQPQMVPNTFGHQIDFWNSLNLEEDVPDHDLNHLH